MSRVVLITGVSRFLGARLAAALAADPSIERVVGIDTVPPARGDLPLLGRTEFVRADIRNPLVAKVLAQARVTTVVHAALTSSHRSLAGRTAMQEMNVVGTMQLLSACQKSDTVERVVVKSTVAVYGGGSAAPAVFAENSRLASDTRGSYGRDAAEVEGYVRGFGRRRPDIATSVLRLGAVLGPTADSALARYLGAPVVPTAVGHDPRLQLLHESDALEALRLATVGDSSGVVNVAGNGVLSLSQAIRRTGRVRVAVPAPLLGAVGAAVGNSGVAQLLTEDPHLLDQGRVVDTTVLRTVFGFAPRHTTAETLESFLVAHRPFPRLSVLGVGVGSRLVRAPDVATPGPAR